MLRSPKPSAQGLVEYGLILLLAVMTVLIILAVLGPAIGNPYQMIVDMF